MLPYMENYCSHACMTITFHLQTVKRHCEVFDIFQCGKKWYDQCRTLDCYSMVALAVEALVALFVNTGCYTHNRRKHVLEDTSIHWGFSMSRYFSFSAWLDRTAYSSAACSESSGLGR